MKNQWSSRSDFQFFFLGNSSYSKDKKKMLSPMYETDIETWSGYRNTSVNGMVNDIIMLIHEEGKNDKLFDNDYCRDRLSEICGRNMNLTPILKSMDTKETLGSMAYYDIYNKWYKILYTVSYCALFFRNNVFMEFLEKKKDMFLFYAHPNDKNLGINSSAFHATRSYDGPHRFTGKNLIGCLLMNIRDAYIYRKIKEEGMETKQFKMLVNGEENFILFDYVVSLLCLKGYSEWVGSARYKCFENMASIVFELPKSSNINKIYQDVVKEVSSYPDVEVLL